MIEACVETSDLHEQTGGLDVYIYIDKCKAKARLMQDQRIRQSPSDHARKRDGRFVHTLPETIMGVETGLLEDCFPLQTGGFPLP